MPPKGGPRNVSGLGRAIMNRRAKQQKQEYQDELHNADLPSGLHSVTQENDLDEFLNTAQLAETDFTAERNSNITLLKPSNTASSNPYLLTAAEEKAVRTRHRENAKKLRVPRRPGWTRNMDREVLEKNERVSFLEWRRSLAELTDQENLLLTPFERNLAVWRQLWRTIERSQLVVQIVDARNPLGFRCEDLEEYVREIEGEMAEEGDEPVPSTSGKRKNLLLVNKADLLTKKQRQIWADYFEANGIAFAFFSALDATVLQEQMAKSDAASAGPLPQAQWQHPESESESESDEEEEEASSSASSSDSVAEDLADRLRVIDNAEEKDPTRVLTCEELEELFMTEAPDLNDFATPSLPPPSKLTIGLVGYPNVGKSSTINALIGSKKVSVSSTPGHTKNFQTIHLPDSSVVLCDCPGLVFPQFATTKAELVCNGVLPIDQMREFTAPVDLLCSRIPKEVLEVTYGLTIHTVPVEEGGTGVPSARELLSTYSVARGYFTAGQGNPDESRAARPILKDYVNGRLLYCTPPPGINADSFNAELRDLERLRVLDKVKLKRAPVTRVGKKADTFISTPQAQKDSIMQSVRSQAVDNKFFAGGTGSGVNFKGHAFGASGPRVQKFPHQKLVGPDGKPMKQPSVAEAMGAGKKQHKVAKRQKSRSGAGYE